LPCIRSPPRSTHCPYTTLFRSERKDLQGKVAAASQPNSFDGWLVGQHELFKNGLNPEKFFKRSVFTHFQFPDALMLLIQGEADRSEEHTSELQSRFDVVFRLLL